MLLTKSFDSFLVKTFRTNVLDNKRWPEAPKSGWLLPNESNEWYSQVNDIVRTCFVVKYLDGVEFLVNKLNKLATLAEAKSTSYFVAGDDGYYAAHLNITQSFEIPLLTFDTEKRQISVELQVTSQLQELIRTLLHRHFEARRQCTPEERSQWQWDYRSDEFATNYLGHILHYLEGMIIDVRDRPRET